MTAGAFSDRPVLDIDPFSEETLANPDPVDIAIREAGPVVWIPKYGVWATGHDAICREVFGDWERFPSSHGTGLANIRRGETWRKPSVILEADPPDHTVTRKVLKRVLSIAALRQLEETFRETAVEIVERLVAKGSFDAAQDLAFAFPFKVLPDSVGMRVEGREHLMPYSTLNFNAMGPHNARYEEARRVVEEMGTLDYVNQQMSRENLAPDGFGETIYAAADAGEISHEDAGMLVRTFISAGIDTTMLGIGITIQCLAERPEQWAVLHKDPSLARFAFEEALRYSPSSPVIARTTAQATTLAGVQLGGDEKVLMYLSSANRDPVRWEQPDTFDILRRPVGHLAFGHGIHNCVGQMVARLEATAVLTALAERVARIEFVGPPRRFINNWLRGYSSLPVKVTPV